MNILDVKKYALGGLAGALLTVGSIVTYNAAQNNDAVDAMPEPVSTTIPDYTVGNTTNGSFIGSSNTFRDVNMTVINDQSSDSTGMYELPASIDSAVKRIESHYNR